MGLFKTKEGALFIGPETVFGAGVAAPAEPLFLEVSEVDFGQLGREWRDAEVLTQEDADDDGMIARVPGERGFTFPMCAPMSDWPDSEDTTQPGVLGDLLKSVLENNEIIGGYGEATGTPTTTSIILGTGEGGSFTVGQLVFVRKGAAGSYRVMCSRIKGISTDTLTLSPPLPAAPVATNPVFGSYCVPKSNGNPVLSLELLYEGAAVTDVRRALGAVCSQAQIVAEPRAYPRLEVRYQCALIQDPDECVALGLAGAPGVQTWPHSKISQVIDGGFYAYDGSNLIKLDGTCTIDFGIELVANDGFSADDPNGIREYFRAARKISVRLNPAYRDNALITMFKTPPATLQLIGWWGTGASVFGWCIPNAVLKNPPNLVDRDGYQAQELVFGCKGYSGDTLPNPAPVTANASFVCGWLNGTITPPEE